MTPDLLIHVGLLLTTVSLMLRLRSLEKEVRSIRVREVEEQSRRIVGSFRA